MARRSADSPAPSFWPFAAGAAVVVHFLACLFSYGGLLSASRRGDTVHYREFATQIVDRGLVPYRDFYVEFPPGALPAFVTPDALGTDHYFLLFKLLMASCGALTLVLAARSLAAVGATRRRYLFSPRSPCCRSSSGTCTSIATTPCPHCCSSPRFCCCSSGEARVHSQYSASPSRPSSFPLRCFQSPASASSESADGERCSGRSRASQG